MSNATVTALLVIKENLDQFYSVIMGIGIISK